MSRDTELVYADHVGRYYQHHYAFAPMTGRLAGFLGICDPPQQTIAELAEALLASRSAIAGAVKELEAFRAVRRTRAAGERVDRVGLNPDAGVNPRGFETAVYTEQSALFREGLALLPETATVQRAVLAEGAALADFMAERLPAVIAEWIVHRDALRAAGTLMDPSNPTRPE
jgi:hypothetical protein